MTEQDADPCGDCMVCQTKLVASLVSDDMRAFLAGCVEAAAQVAAHEVIDGEEAALLPLQSAMVALTVLDEERAEWVVERLEDMGIMVLTLEED